MLQINCAMHHNLHKMVIDRSGRSARVLIEAVASCGIGYQREKSLCSEVVYPRIRGTWRSNDILTVFVVKMTEFH